MKSASMMKILISLLLILAFSFRASAQIENIQHSQISREDGLLRDMPTSILKDSKGFMWFGTGDGLTRYDGYNCKTYLPNKGDLSSYPNNASKKLSK